MVFLCLSLDEALDGVVRSNGPRWSGGWPWSFSPNPQPRATIQWVCAYEARALRRRLPDGRQDVVKTHLVGRTVQVGQQMPQHR